MSSITTSGCPSRSFSSSRARAASWLLAHSSAGTPSPPWRPRSSFSRSRRITGQSQISAIIRICRTPGQVEIHVRAETPADLRDTGVRSTDPRVRPLLLELQALSRQLGSNGAA